MEAPPYSAADVEVVRLPAGRGERDRVAVEEPLETRIGGLPGAAGDPPRGRAGGVDDADAGPRRGARTGLLPLGGPAAVGGPPAGRPRGQHDRRLRARVRRDAVAEELLHD